MGYAAAVKLRAVKACGDLFPRLSVVVPFGKQSGFCSPVVPFSGIVSVLSPVSSLKAIIVSFFHTLLIPTAQS